ncbi:MAG: DEAD/DEAH box helicase, partial [Xanthobacteraceae bacterium]
PETYVHRIGRTARAGADGVAISFCDGEESAYLRDIEKLIRMTIPATDRRSAPRGHSASDGHKVQPHPAAAAKQRQHARGKARRPPRDGHQRTLSDASEYRIADVAFMRR